MDTLYQESSCTRSCTTSLSHVPWHYQLKKSQWVEQPVTGFVFCFCLWHLIRDLSWLVLAAFRLYGELGTTMNECEIWQFCKCSVFLLPATWVYLKCMCIFVLQYSLWIKIFSIPCNGVHGWIIRSIPNMHSVLKPVTLPIKAASWFGMLYICSNSASYK